MTNLTQLIEQWIEGSIHYTDEMLEDNNKRRKYEAGINDFYNELKSKIPDLIEQIEKLTLNGERNRIIEMIRSEEREKLEININKHFDKRIELANECIMPNEVKNMIEMERHQILKTLNK